MSLPYIYDDSMNLDDINKSYLLIDNYFKKLKEIEKEANDYN